MIADGHIIGNHTLTHPDMSQISTLESFQHQLEGVEELYKEVTRGIYEKILPATSGNL